MHTDVGDIKIELQCEKCPKTCEVSSPVNYNKLLLSNYCIALSAELHGPVCQRLLLGLHLPQKHQRLHRANRGPRKHWKRRAVNLGPEVWRRIQWRPQGEINTETLFQIDWNHVIFQHDARGTISMANSGPDTNASQFFIAYGPQPSLDLKYTIFGK